MSTGAAELNPFEQRACEYLLKNPEVIMEALQLANALGVAGTPSFAVHESPRPVPEIQFENGEGEAMSLADFRRKVVLFNIWANGHAPCRREMPTLERLQATLGGPLDRKGLPAVQEFYPELGFEALPIYVDDTNEAQRALAVLGLPTTLLLDRDGNELGRLLGPAEWDSLEMVSFLRDYLKRTAAEEGRQWPRPVRVDRGRSSHARLSFQ